MILVAIVVLLFLQDWRAMILPMIDVPVSLIGTFAVMALMGFTLNNLTLFGLVLAIGIVVDDAIVVLENIERQIATGLDARTATIKAMEEITGPVLAITLVLSAVFIPCCFLGGITGQFFRQFAVTIAVSTIISAINALTMTPSRAVLIFKADDRNPGHEHRKEALPWWIFGTDRRHRHLLVLAGPTWPALVRVPGCRPGMNRLTDWLAIGAGILSISSRPDAGSGVACWAGSSSAGERRAGLVLPGFQPLFRPDDRRLWAAVGRTLRLSSSCCWSTAACWALTYLAVQPHAHRLHPAAGQGLSDPQRAVAGIGFGASDRARS